MRKALLLTATVLLIGYADLALAASCKIEGISRTCEFNCSSGQLCQPASHAICDTSNDGICVICGKSGADVIFGTTGDDWICGKGGADQIWTENPLGAASFGTDTVDGSGGNDIIVGDGGNDDLHGGSGNDTISSGGGTDALNGGTGNDTLNNSAGFASEAGTTMCGGAGNDVLQALGAGFFCLDCGSGQSPSGFDGDYWNNFTGGNTGSIINCANPNPVSNVFSPPAPCGCSE